MVRLSAVSKQYAARATPVRALREVSLHVPRGEICALVGPTGSGKSTLLAIMGGLDRPSSGRVRIDGRELSRLSGRHLASFRLARVGMVFQAHNLIPVLTAAENVALPLALQGVERGDRRRRVDRLLAELSLTEVAKHRPPELSGGQQQRVGIARALVNEPALVLADEPTASLDEKTTHEVLALLRTINTQARTTLVIATHDSTLQLLATHRVCLRAGHVVADGNADSEHAG